jgi:hypothetical protein
LRDTHLVNDDLDSIASQFRPYNGMDRLIGNSPRSARFIVAAAGGDDDTQDYYEHRYYFQIIFPSLPQRKKD